MDEEDSDDRFQQLARVKVLSFVKNNDLGQCVLYFLVFLWLEWYMGHEEMDTPIIRVLICHKKRRISEKNSELSVILLNSKRDLFSSPNSHDQKYFPDKRSAELPTIDRAKL